MRRLLAVLQGFLVAAWVPLAYAADADSPVSQGLWYLINTIYGATGVALATCAIIGVGLLCLIHVLEWKRLMQTIIGVCVIFGAGAVVAGIKALVSH